MMNDFFPQEFASHHYYHHHHHQQNMRCLLRCIIGMIVKNYVKKIKKIPL